MNIEYHQGGGDNLRRYSSKKLGSRISGRGFFALCLLLCGMIITASAVNSRLKPIAFELAKSYGSKAALDVMSKTVSDYFDSNDIGYSDLVRLKYNSSGFVTSVEYDSEELNKMKLGCLSALSKSLSKLRYSKIKVPLGSIFGDLSLSGRGPRISVRLSETAVPDIELLSTFEAVGFNQSRHELRLRVTADVTVYLPPRSEEFSVTQDYVLAQTVIVGDIPSGYAFLD